MHVRSLAWVSIFNLSRERLLARISIWKFSKINTVNKEDKKVSTWVFQKQNSRRSTISPAYQLTKSYS